MTFPDDRGMEPGMNAQRVALPGSAREHVPQAELSVRGRGAHRSRRRWCFGGGPAAEPACRWHDQPLAARGAVRRGPADIEVVARAVAATGAEVLDSDPASRRVRVSGSARSLESLFGTKLERPSARCLGFDGHRHDPLDR